MSTTWFWRGWMSSGGWCLWVWWSLWSTLLLRRTARVDTPGAICRRRCTKPWLTWSGPWLSPGSFLHVPKVTGVSIWGEFQLVLNIFYSYFSFISIKDTCTVWFFKKYFTTSFSLFYKVLWTGCCLGGVSSPYQDYPMSFTLYTLLSWCCSFIIRKFWLTWIL